MTFGLALVIDRVIVLIWGDDTHPVTAPDAINGTTSVFGTDYPTYRLMIILIAGLLAAGARAVAAPQPRPACTSARPATTPRRPRSSASTPTA